jgi:cytidine deaminase
VLELSLMKYCQVTSYMSKGPVVMSNNHMCAERQLIRRLYRECLKKGYKPHQFTEWLHRKHGELIIERRNIHGDAVSLPCVLCRKAMERFDIHWAAHDGTRWVHSKKSEYLPPSIPTAKQKRMLGFGCNN